MARRATRDEATIDIDQMSSSLVAVTDPTARSQLRELEHSLGRLPGEQREVILDGAEQPHEPRSPTNL